MARTSYALPPKFQFERTYKSFLSRKPTAHSMPSRTMPSPAPPCCASENDSTGGRSVSLRSSNRWYDRESGDIGENGERWPNDSAEKPPTIVSTKAKTTDVGNQSSSKPRGKQ